MFRPLDNRVMIEPLPPSTQLLEKYDLPQGSIPPPTEGKVVGLGEGVTEIKIGDIALYDKNYGVNIIDEGKTYRILEKRDIFAVK